jgi:sulfatase maturation enzyme AslB (radical SAM superfamily)
MNDEMLAIARKYQKEIGDRLGNFCNQTCLHCHVEASPSGSIMDREVMEKIIDFIQKNLRLS